MKRENPFFSPSRGRLTFGGLVADLMAFINEQPEAHYKLIVGTDSHTRQELCFVSAIIVHRVGKGARYYYQRHRQRPLPSLRQRIYYETAHSLELAQRLTEALAGSDLNVEIHLDVGERGATRELIREVVGMVTGNGFAAQIKPHSFGASKVADRYTK